LAYYHGPSVIVYDLARGRSTAVLQAGNASSFFSYGVAIHWSPDSRRVAVVLPVPDGARYPQEMRVRVAPVDGRAATTITIRFPAGLLAHGPAGLGSYPESLMWTRDGQRFVVSTVLNGEGGPRLSGLWHVGVHGGTAQLFVGKPHDPQGHFPLSPALAQATSFLLSPDGTHLLTDPDRRFWVADAEGLHGHYLRQPGLCRSGSTCVLTQFTWLSDSATLAAVAVRTLPSGSSGKPFQAPTFRSTLFILGRQGGAPRAVLHVDGPDAQALVVAAPVRCVDCGF